MQVSSQLESILCRWRCTLTALLLVAVLGMAQVLGETHLSQEQRDCLATLYQSGKHLLSLINHVLEFSQIQAEHISLAQHEFQIQDVVRDIVDTWHGVAQKKQVALTFEASLSAAFSFMAMKSDHDKWSTKSLATQ